MNRLDLIYYIIKTVSALLMFIILWFVVTFMSQELDYFLNTQHLNELQVEVDLAFPFFDNFNFMSMSATQIKYVDCVCSASSFQDSHLHLGKLIIPQFEDYYEFSESFVNSKNHYAFSDGDNVSVSSKTTKSLSTGHEPVDCGKPIFFPVASSIESGSSLYPKDLLKVMSDFREYQIILNDSINHKLLQHRQFIYTYKFGAGVDAVMVPISENHRIEFNMRCASINYTIDVLKNKIGRVSILDSYLYHLSLSELTKIWNMATHVNYDYAANYMRSEMTKACRGVYPEIYDVYEHVLIRSLKNATKLQ